MFERPKAWRRGWWGGWARGPALALAALLAAGAVLLAHRGAAAQAPPAAPGVGVVPLKPTSLDEAETFLPRPVPLDPPIDEQVLTLAFSRDDTRLVTGGARWQKPGQLKVWDVKTGRELATVQGVRGIRSLAISPDGETLVTGHFGGAISLRDPRTGQERATAKGHTVGVNAVAYSADGKWLVSAGLDRAVKLWDARTLKEQKTFLGHTDMVYAAAFFHHGRDFVTAGKDRTVRVWDVETGGERLTLRGHRDAVEAVAISADDRTIATGSWDQTITLWDAETGKDKAVLKSPGGAVLALAFAPDGKRLASAGMDGTVCLWDVEAGKLTATLPRHREAVWALAFSHDGKYLASGSSDKTAVLWDVATGRAVKTMVAGSPPDGPVLAVDCAPDGGSVAVATADGKVRVRNAETGAIVFGVAAGADGAAAVKFAPDGQTLATAGRDGSVQLWDRATGKEKRTLKGHAGGAYALAFSPDGRKLVTAGEDRMVRVWDAGSGEEAAALKGHAAAVRALAVGPDGRGLASGDADGAIKLWDLSRAAEVATLEGHKGVVRALAYAADSHTLASAGDDSTVKLWDVHHGKERLALKGHTGGVRALAFSPGGRTLVSGGQDARLIVWDPASGRARAALPAHGPAAGAGDDLLRLVLPGLGPRPAGVTALAIPPQGEYLLSGGSDGAVLRWSGAGAVADARNVPGEKNANAAQAPAAAPPARPMPVLPPDAKTLYRDFRARPSLAPLDLFGEGADTFCHPEDGGFRMTVPAVRPGATVGLILTSPVSGNFEITTGYELLKVDTPQVGMAGLEVYVMTATPTQEAIGFYRVVSGGEGDMFKCLRMTYEGGKRRYKTVQQPAASKGGRLRLTRQGSEVVFWAADGPGDDFRELCHYDLGREDLRMVRLAAYASTPHPVDLRLTDLKIRADDLDAGADTGAVTGGGGSNSRSKGWLAAAVIIGLLTGLAFVGAWLLARRRRAGKPPAAAPVPDTLVRPAAAAPPLVFACPGCGHGLKVKAELAGKKGKCPKCGNVLLVPAPVQEARPGGGPA